MRNVSNRRRRGNLLPLPLFTWATRVERERLPLQARWVARRCGLPPSVAAVVAEHVFRGDQR